jgi:HEAT repeat protein
MHRSTLLVLLLTPYVLVAQEARIAERTKTEWLKILREDESARRREGAVVALGLMKLTFPGEKGIVEAFRDAILTDKADRVRLKALTVMRDFDKTDLRPLVPAMADVLKGDKVPGMRAAAAGVLAKCSENAKPALLTLIEAFKDTDATVRTAAADAIGRIGEEAKSAVPSLVLLLKDADANVRHAAVFALGRVGPEAATAVADLAKLIGSDPDANVRKEAVRACSFLGLDAKGALSTLGKALREDKSEEVRQQCAIALGKMGSEVRVVLPMMLDALKGDPDKTVRVYIVNALGSALGSGLKAHVKLLADQLKVDQDGEVRYAIVQELGSLGPDAIEAVPALQRAVADVQVTVREAARAAIRKITMPVKNSFLHTPWGAVHVRRVHLEPTVF